MNIGFYVTTLHPQGASQTRMQEAVLTGLSEVAADRYTFHVFSHDAELPPGRSRLQYHSLQVHSEPPQAVHFAKRALAIPLASMLCRAGYKRGCEKLKQWSAVPEPAYFDQLRRYNIRLLWNINQHELPCRIPYVRTVWDINHRIYPMFPEYSHTRFTFAGLDRNFRDSLARASYVITGTNIGKQELISIYGVAGQKVRVIPFPTPLLTPSSHNIRQRDMILYPARFWPHKNHVLILEALNILRSKYDWSLKCVFTGVDEGNLAYVLGYAENLGIRNLIEYKGSISQQELADLYSAALALVYPSAVGPDNLPPLEAMSLRCPVITADVPGAREQFGHAALYFPPMDEATLVDRLLKIRDDNKLRLELVENGAERAARYTVNDYTQRMLQILDEFSLLARNWERCDSDFT